MQGDKVGRARTINRGMVDFILERKASVEMAVRGILLEAETRDKATERIMSILEGMGITRNPSFISVSFDEKGRRATILKQIDCSVSKEELKRQEVLHC